MDKFVYSLPKKSNTSLHVLTGITYGKQPLDLQVGEVAEPADSAYTFCKKYLKRFEVVAEKPEGMKECQACFDEDANEQKEKYRDRARDLHVKDVPIAIADTLDWVKRRKT